MEAFLLSLQTIELSIYLKIGLIFGLGILHALISQPWSAISVSLSIYFFGLLLGISLLMVVYTLGNMLFYVIVRKVHEKYEDIYFNWIKKGLKWIKKHPPYKHMIAVGLPLVPTFFIKMSLPVAIDSFWSYMLYATGSYVILTTSNVLFHYGILVSLLRGEMTWMTSIVLMLCLIILYFGHYVKSKWF